MYLLRLYGSEVAIYASIAIAFAVVLLCDAKRCRYSIPVKMVGYGLLGAIAISSMVSSWPMDWLSAFFSLLAVIVSMAVTSYAEGYEERKFPGRNLRTLIDLFALSVYAVFASPNLIAFIMFWIIAEIAGFFAIVFEIEQRTLVAGLRYLIVSMIPADIALIALLALASMKLGFSKAMLLPMSSLPHVLGALPVALGIMMALGFMAKAAVAPLHFWLPDAHALAPAPASAILSGIMVKMGIYGLLRIAPCLTPTALAVVMGFACLTVVYGGLQALVQSDAKRLLAYSTIENTSLMVMALALGSFLNLESAFVATYLLVAAHAIFKASLFMDSGIVEIAAHTREIYRLGYLSRYLTTPSISTLISVLSLMGVPPTIGFLAKLYLFMCLINAIYRSLSVGIPLIVVTAVGTALAIAYGLKYLSMYWGALEKEAEVEKLSDRRLLGSELGVASTSIGLAIPMYVAIAGLSSATMLYVLPLAFVQVFFVALLYYVYTHIRMVARERQWLGGALP